MTFFKPNRTVEGWWVISMRYSKRGTESESIIGCGKFLLLMWVPDLHEVMESVKEVVVG